MGKHKNLVIVKAVIEQGLSVSQTARKYGISRQWVYTLLHRYQQHGPEALTTGSRTPTRHPHRTPGAVRERILALRSQLHTDGADAGAETIAWHLRNEGHHAPSKATIHRILRAAGLVTDEPRKRPKSSLRRFAASLPNETWQADITYWRLRTGMRVEILDFLDDHSRYLLSLQAHLPCTGATVVSTMHELIGIYGPPASTLTDNGLVFTSRLASRPGARNGFEILLATEGIQQKNGSPGHPQTQGKIERFHQTLKRWLAAQQPATSLGQLQDQLDEFR
ncbi:IS481 family transposase, partial [Actinocorallia glomerata]